MNHRLLYDTVDTAVVEELYDHYGGAATYALHIPQEAPGRGLGQHLFPLREAVASCDTAQVGRALGRGGAMCSMCSCIAFSLVEMCLISMLPLLMKQQGLGPIHYHRHLEHL